MNNEKLTTWIQDLGILSLLILAAIGVFTLILSATHTEPITEPIISPEEEVRSEDGWTLSFFTNFSGETKHHIMYFTEPMTNEEMLVLMWASEE